MWKIQRWSLPGGGRIGVKWPNGARLILLDKSKVGFRFFLGLDPDLVRKCTRTFKSIRTSLLRGQEAEEGGALQGLQPARRTARNLFSTNYSMFISTLSIVSPRSPMFIVFIQNAKGTLPSKSPINGNEKNLFYLSIVGGGGRQLFLPLCSKE